MEIPTLQQTIMGTSKNSLISCKLLEQLRSGDKHASEFL